jgi:CRP-like cAMP-binding protein
MQTDLILKNISKHIQLSDREKEYFLSLLQWKTLNRNEPLLRPGEICRTENFIVGGSLRMYAVDDKGIEHTVMLGIEEWWISDLYSLFTKQPSSYFIAALVPSQLLQLKREDLERLYKKVPGFERFFRIMFQNAFVAQQERIHQNLSLPAAERYAAFLKKYPLLEQRIPQKYIASYLGMTPVFLSMLRKKMASGHLLK